MINDIDLSGYIDKLPSQSTYAEGKLTWNDTPIANFMPYVRRKIQLHTDYGIEDFFTLEIIQGESIINSKDIKISGINNVNWFEIDNHCIIYPDSPKAKVYLNSIIQHMLGNNDLEVIRYRQIEKVGWNRITISDEDIYCYNTGDNLILPQDNDISERITLKKSDWILEKDTEKYSEKKATEIMTKAISLNKKAGLPIFSFTIAALLKSIFTECGISPKFMLYICGDKDLMKTAYVSMLSPIFHRNNNLKLLIQFNSSTYAIDSLLNDYPDFVVIFDNVYISEHEEIHKQILKRFEEAVQIIGDNTGKSKSGRQYTPSSSIIATGEFDGIGNPSTISRYLTIPFGNDLQSTQKQILLHECQNESLAISTFYCYFLKWIVDNIEDIKTSIKDLLEDFRAVQNRLNIGNKLKERYFILLTSYMLSLRYCSSKKFITNKQAIQLKNEFDHQLLRLCYRHNQTIIEKENKEATSTDDFLRLIKYWYRNNEFDMAKDANDKHLKSREALIYEKYLCLRTKSLVEKIKKSFPSIKVKDVIAQLVAKKVLKSDSDKNTAKIKGLRFLKIPLDKLN